MTVLPKADGLADSKAEPGFGAGVIQTRSRPLGFQSEVDVGFILATPVFREYPYRKVEDVLSVQTTRDCREG